MVNDVVEWLGYSKECFFDFGNGEKIKVKFHAKCRYKFENTTFKDKILEINQQTSENLYVSPRGPVILILYCRNNTSVLIWRLALVE